jgi:uncharacterized membrane protein
VDTPWAVKWNTAGTPTTLPAIKGGAVASGVNLNGSAIVGWTNVDDSLGSTLAAVWSGAIKPTTYQGSSIGYFSSASRVSADGTTVIGTAADDSSSNNRAAYWRVTDTIHAPTIIDPGTYLFNQPYGASADGSVIVGQSNMGPTIVAFRWAKGTWGTLPNYTSASTSSARGVSDDGKVTVGNSGGQAVRWVGTATPQLLGIEGNGYAASADGRIIVGVIGNPASGSSLAFIWDAANGVRSLDDVVTGLGANLGGWSMAEATDVSDDGSVIVGWATNGTNEAAWMVNLAGTGVSGL